MKKRTGLLLAAAVLLTTGCRGAVPPADTVTTTAPTAVSTTATAESAPSSTDAATTASTTASSLASATTAGSKATAAATKTDRTTKTAKSTTATTAATTKKSTTTSTRTTVSTTVSTTTTTVATARQEVSVTIPEGYTFMQIARLLESKGVCTAAEFTRVCQSYTPRSFTIPLSTDRCFRMEGYLFPDTYRFYVDDDPQTVLIRMLNNYHDKVGNLSDETLILASIIEREARSDEHMKLVSSVYHNRLNNRAEFPYLNADPTRDYVNAYITGNALVSDPSRYVPLYNTCGKRKGLPAGPICNPGLRAIRAAQQPTASPYYYFFYGTDHTNHYSETLEEHNQKIAEIGVG